LREYICVLVLAIALGPSFGCSRGPGGVRESSARAVSTFGNEVSLEAYAIRPKDGHTEVELTWTAVGKPAADYYAFIHAIDSSGNILFQLDHPLKNGAGQLTSSWTTGDSVKDRFMATPPQGHSPGAYTLRIGVYVPQPMKVLQITRTGFPQPKDGWSDRAIVIEQVSCQ
jgi:hypothetical protein